MARIHARKRGKSGSTRPIGRGAPRWVKYKKGEIEELVAKYAKEGKSSSEIGLILRDQYGIPLIKRATGKKTSQIMKDDRNCKKITFKRFDCPAPSRLKPICPNTQILFNFLKSKLSYA